LAGIVTVALSRHSLSGIGRFAPFAYFFLATASHGVLDAMTNGGLGVAFFSPFDNNRYFLPWRPILVSPISVHRFFSGRGYAVLQSELLWIWVPAIVFAAVVLMLRHSEHIQGTAD
jgi:inner membrane protein